MRDLSEYMGRIDKKRHVMEINGGDPNTICFFIMFVLCVLFCLMVVCSMFAKCVLAVCWLFVWCLMVVCLL